MTATPNRAAAWLAWTAFFVLPLVLRLTVVTSGSDRSFTPTAGTVNNALAIAANRDLAPEWGSYTQHPNVGALMLLAPLGVHYALGRSEGKWTTTREFGDYALTQPQSVNQVARLVSAFASALAVWLTFLALSRRGATLGAWAVGLLLTFGLAQLAAGQIEVPWALCAAFCAATLLVTGGAREGRVWSAVLAGLFSGAAYGTLDLGVVALLVALCDGPWRRQPARLAVVLVTFLVVGVGLGHPHAFSVPHSLSAAFAAVFAAERAAAAWTPLSVLIGAELVALAFALAGSLGRAGRASIGASLAGASALGILIWQHSSSLPALSVVLILWAPAAAFGAEWLARTRVGLPVLGLLLVATAATGLRYVWVHTRLDTRADAVELAFALPLGACAATDLGAPTIPLSHEALDRLQSIRERYGSGLDSAERRRRRLLGQGALAIDEAGFDAIALGDLCTRDEQGLRLRPNVDQLGATLTDVLDAIGVTHVLIVDEPTPELRNQLAPVDEDARVDPFAGGEALPLAALSIWHRKRPGPQLAMRTRRRP